MENFISDTEINIKQKISCRMFFCIALEVWVYIRFFGHGCWRFRPYGGLLGKAPSNQALLPLSFGASP
jgi:hypothetical protein